jgi:hypothetical protein
MGEPARNLDAPRCAQDAPTVSHCAPLRGSGSRLSFLSPLSLKRQDGFRIPCDAEQTLEAPLEVSTASESGSAGAHASDVGLAARPLRAPRPLSPRLVDTTLYRGEANYPHRRTLRIDSRYHRG